MVSAPNNDELEQAFGELVEALANVFRERDKAMLILQKVGFPSQDLPDFDVPLHFWNRVVREIRNGKPPGDMAKVAGAAAVLYEHNPMFPDLQKRIGRMGSQPPLPTVPKLAPPRLPSSTTKLVGRKKELARLDAAWQSSGPGKVNIVAIVAWGGVGKTALVFEWMNRLARKKWHGAQVVFEWSFYDQGGRAGAPSGEPFVDAALRFLGDTEMADRSVPAWDKGVRLAELVAARRTLLVLDGLERLQHPPSHVMKSGALTDLGVEALLHGLARHNRGLCVVTTRQDLPRLTAFGASVSEWALKQLSEEDGVTLLGSLLGRTQPKGPAGGDDEAEMLAICKAVDGHALTLSLLGKYLRRRKWDVRRWREIRFNDADDAVQGGHVFRMMSEYECWLAEAPSGEEQLAVLRLLGLFDRPADPICIEALCKPPAIDGLTEALVGLDEEGWTAVLADLEALGLVSRMDWRPPLYRGFPKERTNSLTGETIGDPETFVGNRSRLTTVLDAHPLVREHFGRSVAQARPDAWRNGHTRLFEHLCLSTPYWPHGLESLQPLYQAVAHGCQAGRVQKACDDVYFERILRGGGNRGFYSTKRLGAFGTDLAATAWFFSRPWTRPDDRLSDNDQTWFLVIAASSLRALGRLDEAIKPLEIGLQRAERAETTTAIQPGEQHRRYSDAARLASLLSEMELARGEVAAASSCASRSVEYADQSQDEHQRMVTRATLGHALLHENRYDEALRAFWVAEQMQTSLQPGPPRLHSMQGFQYCELLLSEVERAAWRATIASGNGLSSAQLLASCMDVLDRATRARVLAADSGWLLDIALDDLTLGRASLYCAVLALPHDQPVSQSLANAQQHLHEAVEGLRRSGDMSRLPQGLLSRAWLHCTLADQSAAEADLNNAENLSKYCGMPIHRAEIHLARARLFRDRKVLDEARSLFQELDARGYRRHRNMLADAEAAAELW